jgi:hypothetical protein
MFSAAHYRGLRGAIVVSSVAAARILSFILTVPNQRNDKSKIAFIQAIKIKKEITDIANYC